MSILSHPGPLLPKLLRRDRSAGRWCRECGYSLRGLSVDQACPECGFSAENASRTSAHSAWARSVSIGLALMLLVTLHAVSSVLIQPFVDGIGGTAPALNLPAPKLWAVPLLQRPIGHAPEQPGVIGTRIAILSLLSIWLITAPYSSSRLKNDQTLRLLTRWGCVTLFGLALGAMLASNGLWTDDLPPFRLLLVGCVELPGTALLYLYLRKIAFIIPGRDRRSSFDTLAWATPLVILGGAVMLGFQWLQLRDSKMIDLSHGTVVFGTAVYGCIGLLVGVAATASIGGLLGATAPIAFPSFLRVVRISRGLAMRGLRTAAEIGAGNGRRLAVALGLVLLLVLVVVGNDQLSWMTLRQGLGGNLPFVNFPGPKLWLSVVISENFARYWSPILSNVQLVILNLLCAWLITVELPGARRSALRTWLRWLPVVSIGAAIGATVTTRYYMNNPAANEMELFAFATVLMEMPATILLYAYLAHLAETCRDARLAAGLRTACVAIVALVATSMLMCALSKHLLNLRLRPVTLTLASMYGAASLLTAVWTCGLIVRLICRVMLRPQSHDIATRLHRPTRADTALDCRVRRG